MLLLIQVPEINTMYGLMQKSKVLFVLHLSGCECCKDRGLSCEATLCWFCHESHEIVVSSVLRLMLKVFTSTAVTNSPSAGGCRKMEAPEMFSLTAKEDSTATLCCNLRELTMF